jgi:hypothetical protein
MCHKMPLTCGVALQPPMRTGQVLYAAKGAFGKDGKDSEADGAAKFAESIKVCRRLSSQSPCVWMHAMQPWVVEDVQRHPVCHKSVSAHACVHTHTCTFTKNMQDRCLFVGGA